MCGQTEVSVGRQRCVWAGRDVCGQAEMSVGGRDVCGQAEVSVGRQRCVWAGRGVCGQAEMSVGRQRCVQCCAMCGLWCALYACQESRGTIAAGKKQQPDERERESNQSKELIVAR